MSYRHGLDSWDSDQPVGSEATESEGEACTVLGAITKQRLIKTQQTEKTSVGYSDLYSIIVTCNSES
jgi:hypothetical protein